MKMPKRLKTESFEIFRFIISQFGVDTSFHVKFAKILSECQKQRKLENEEEKPTPEARGVWN